MPSKTGNTGLLRKLGTKLNDTMAKAAAAPVNYGIIRLPGGINGGVAQLDKCYFAQYEGNTNQKKADGTSAAGEYYFRATGVMHSPESVVVNGVAQQVRGLHTSVLIPLCDTKNTKGEITTQAQHLMDVVNEMQKLGGEGYCEGAGVEDLERLASELVDLKPFFRVSTRQGKATPEYPEPRVFETWHGSRGLEDYSPEVGGKESFQDDSSAPPTRRQPPTANGTEKQSEPKGNSPPASVLGKTGGKAAPPPVFDETTGDLTSLADQADGGDDEAIIALTEIADKAGLDPEAVEAASSWHDVVSMLSDEATTANDGPEGEDGENEEGSPDPKKGDIFGFKPVDPRTRKPVARPIDVEVVVVDVKKRTVNIKSLDKGTLYKGVSWDDLIAQ